VHASSCNSRRWGRGVATPLGIVSPPCDP
jgi:hypothetical protein